DSTLIKDLHGILLEGEEEGHPGSFRPRQNWVGRIGSTAAEADFVPPPEQEITESQRRLEQIRRERAQLRDEMTRIRSRVSDLSSELRNLGRQVETSAGLLQELENQMDQREEQIERNTVELLVARDRLAERRAILHYRLRDIYKRGPLQTWEVLLSADSFSDLLNRYKYLFMLARHDRRLADDVEELEVELVARERALRGNLGQLTSLRAEREFEFGQLAALEGQQQEALTNVQSRQQTTAQRIDQLERDEARLSELITALERRRREAELAAEAGRGPSGGVADPATASLTPARMGSLDWPVDGPLLYRFGRQTQPNGTVVRWNGIGIGARAGATVRAVESGTVVLAGPFEGYGPTVVVSHGGGYYSLYLYLRDVRVSEGATVARDQPLGTVGGESSSEGPHLEFQIRAPGGQAIDPTIWLRRR
ncbi:MAG: peptidoglycan DD-metalloendopeptidase family protein, partial [Gemmatimonadota bacterium]